MQLTNKLVGTCELVRIFVEDKERPYLDELFRKALAIESNRSASVVYRPPEPSQDDLARASQNNHRTVEFSTDPERRAML